MVTIRYRDESLPLIGMHNSCPSNCNLDTERVTGSVDDSHSRGNSREETQQETVSQRQTQRKIIGSLGVFLCGAIWGRVQWSCGLSVVIIK